MNNKTAKAWVTGQVQGVGFRYFTAHEAHKLDVKGYAKNLNDGRVEVLASGSESSVAELLKWLEDGPRTARVDALVYEYIDFQAAKGFEMY